MHELKVEGLDNRMIIYLVSLLVVVLFLSSLASHFGIFLLSLVHNATLCYVSRCILGQCFPLD